MSDITLTPQQQAVVAHDHGPALVFAVAGAGKTTALVHRIERLVREEVFPPEQILATSFGRSNVLDLRRELGRWPHCRPVETRTLHALGRELVGQAQTLGGLSGIRLDEAHSGDVGHKVLNAALAEARRRAVPWARELDGLDRADFLDYVGACKGQLLYADLDAAQLPAAARAAAGQAEPPPTGLAWYLDLYQLFEQARLHGGYLTFDDMLMTGWQALATLPELLEQAQSRYRCVLVDEYQDINQAQSEILDLLTAPERHYMAVGDDDQTIYEWRGASPQFILRFAGRYGAREFVMDENFRCPAGPLALANRVIEHNKQRAPKQLQLTRGFTGETELVQHKDPAALARRIVRRVRRQQREVRPLNDVAILVRLHAQTPIIEQALIAAEIPYRVSQPFYERAEILTLIHYCRLAWLERELHARRRPLGTASARDQLAGAWRDIANRPKRYLTRELQDALQTAFFRGDAPLSVILRRFEQMVEPDWLVERLAALADLLAWLARSLDQPAGAVLAELDAQLGYQTFLRENSGFAQTGEGRAAGVAALIAYARERGTLLEFLQHLRQLAEQRVGQGRAGDAVTLSTIHQAKGLEWPLVIVVQPNEEILPFNGSRCENMEEERRLLYVAITRCRRDLELHATSDRPLSRFLQQANWQLTLDRAAGLGRVLSKDPAGWGLADALVLLDTAPGLDLRRYLTDWSPPELRRQLARGMQRFFATARARDLWGTLALQSADASWWTALDPPDEPPPADFAPLLPPSPAEATAAVVPAAPAQPPDPPAGADATQRRRHLLQLGRLREPAALRRLADYLQDPDVSIAWLAGAALESIGDEQVAAALRDYLAGSPEPAGRRRAEKLLAALTAA